MTVSASPARRDMIQRILHQYLRPDWGRLVVAMICAAGVAAMSAGFAELMKPAVDRLFSHHDARALFQLPLAIAAVAVVRTLFQVFQSRIMNQVGHGLVGRIQVELFGHLIRADLQRLRAEHSGAYVSKVLFDATLMREAFTNGVVNYLQNALIVVGSVLVMLSRDVPLTLIVLLGAPVAGFTLRKFSKRTKKAAQGAMNETSTLSSAIMEGLDGVKIVKIENREAFEEKRVSEVISRRQAFIIKGANARANAAPITELITALITAAVFAYAGWRAQTGGMTVGSFIAFLGALTMAGQSLRQLANLQTVMSEGMTAAKRLFAALDIAPEVREQPGAIATERGQGALAIEDVSFSYADGAPALEAVSIVANPGETVALVGPSGGGKSTLLSLIPRFFDPSAGRITLDGVDVRHLTLASLRHHLALVTQEPFLFDDTIAANIAYGRPDATQEEIERAATAAAAHEFILGLSSGYQTQVGEAGARLSGGQRQRIAIARAFLKDAPILLLDEATSALDAESEARVQDALERLMKGRTTILIAHRLSTVQNADRIYVVDSGRVVESGRHSELIAEGGLYARLAAGQNLGLERSAS